MRERGGEQRFERGAVTGMLLGTLLAAEPSGLRQAVGTVLVVAGVLLGVARARRHPEPGVTPSGRGPVVSSG